MEVSRPMTEQRAEYADGGRRCGARGELSEEICKCTHCGKPFDGEDGSGGGRAAIGGGFR